MSQQTQSPKAPSEIHPHDPDSKPKSKISAVATPKIDSIESRLSLKSFSAEELAEALAQKLAIAPNDWHRLSANRVVRAREQAAAALVYMLKDKPEEALPRLTQAIGWLNKTLKAPPCPTHGEKRTHSKEK